MIYKVNTISLLLSKVFAVGSIYYIIPASMELLSLDKYGVWVIINSVFTWFTLFDFGLANTYRTKLTIANNNADYEVMRTYLSSLFVFFAALAGCIFFGLSVASYFINWSTLFNSSSLNQSEITYIILGSTFFLLGKLILDCINILLISIDKSFLIGVSTSVSSLFSVVFLYLYKKLGGNSFLTFALVMAFIPFFISFCLNIFVHLVYKKYQFSWSKSNYKILLVDARVSIQFFVVQIMYLLIFSVDTLLVARLFSASEVATYNTSYRYFNLVNIFLATVLIPIVPQFTTYFESSMRSKIVHLFSRLYYLLAFIAIGLLLMVFTAPILINWWVSGRIVLSNSILVANAVFVLIMAWSSIHACFLNALNKTSLQFKGSIVAGVLNIPLILFCVKVLDLGLAGVFVGTSLCMLAVGAWLTPWECFAVIEKMKKN